MCKPNSNGRTRGYAGCEVWQPTVGHWSDGSDGMVCPVGKKHDDARATGFNKPLANAKALAKADQPDIFSEYEKLYQGGLLSSGWWIKAGGTKEQAKEYLAQAKAQSAAGDEMATHPYSKEVHDQLNRDGIKHAKAANELYPGRNPKNAHGRLVKKAFTEDELKRIYEDALEQPQKPKRTRSRSTHKPYEYYAAQAHKPTPKSKGHAPQTPVDPYHELYVGDHGADVFVI